MFALKPDAVDLPRLNISWKISRLVSAVERFVGTRGEGVVITSAFAGFFVLWTLYHTISNISVATDSDTSEVSVWAQHFAFGYKHPPLTAWIFSLWFSVFPRSDFAVHLLGSAVTTSALAVTWRLLRDHLDLTRALVGLTALTLVPFYTCRAATLDANTVMMPFWAAALLFYLRARKGHGSLDAALAGAFAGLAFLGKYWAVHLVAGIMVASVVGAETKAFWRSRAPYVIAVIAAIVVAPHVNWYLAARGGDNYTFMMQDVLIAESFAGSLARSGRYLEGSAASVAAPLVFFAALLPSRAALADTIWPRDEIRRQALVLLVVPLLLPALVNPLFPQRLSPVWTFPNWPLLPVVLYGSPLITRINARAAARSVIIAFLLSLGAVAVAPIRACVKLQAKAANIEDDRAYYVEVAAAAERFAERPVRVVGGSWRIVRGLSFYLPEARILRSDPADPGNRAEISAKGIVIICSHDDAPCLASAARFAAIRTADITVVRTFLGFESPPSRYRITVVPGHTDDSNGPDARR